MRDFRLQLPRVQYLPILHLFNEWKFSLVTSLFVLFFDSDLVLKLFKSFDWHFNYSVFLPQQDDYCLVMKKISNQVRNHYSCWGNKSKYHYQVKII